MMRLVHICCAIALFALSVPSSWAAGPKLRSDQGPYRWADGNVAWYIDGGNLGSLSNADVINMINSAFAVWSGMGIQGGGSNVTPVSVIKPQFAGSVNLDINESNFSNKEQQYKDKGVLVVLDETGNIMRNANMDPGTYAAYARITSTDGTTNTIKGAVIVLSGLYKGNKMAKIVTHEIGHALNLDHTAINAELFDLTTNAAIGNLAGAALMFPIVSDQGGHLDDAMSLALVNPIPAVTDNLCTIQGHVVDANGAGLPGALIRAHNTNNPAIISASMVTGALATPAKLDGFYKLVLPPGNYNLFMTSVPQKFTGGSSVGPIDPPISVPDSALSPQEVSCAKGAIVTMDTLKISEPLPTSGLSKAPPADQAAGDGGGGGGGGCSLLK